MSEWLQSKRVKSAAATAIVAIVGDRAGLDHATIELLVGIGISLVLGFSTSDTWGKGAIEARSKAEAKAAARERPRGWDIT